MRKVSIVKLISFVFVVMLASTLLVQCKKEDSNAVIQGLDRAYKGTADSTVYASFYNLNLAPTADVTPQINDSINFRGIQAILKENCSTGNCHGGPISPKFDSYSDVMKYVTAGNPGASKLWEYITTNDFKKAMPPVSVAAEVSNTDKAIIYNWINNGAKEKPDVNDYRPAAVQLIVKGCTSGNCHNEFTGTGAWARKPGLITFAASDTTSWTYTNPSTGAKTIYCELTNNVVREAIMKEYKDSVRKFYSDTLANASYRPYKTFSTPISASSTRGPLNTYDNIIFDITYPKGLRSNTSVSYTDPVSKKAYYVKGNNLSGTSAVIYRLDSTLLMADPTTGVYTTSNTGGMANQDGGLKPNEIALVKAWYFSDPNVPDVWKYGKTGAGIFKYKRSGTIITKK
jgi:hypothetical protein